jgi:predicted adenylyl cyclase CyaB
VASNIEIKAHATNWEHQRCLAQQLSHTPVQRIAQEDVFFPSRAGRLKLRILSPTVGELIYYERPDATGPKQSSYSISRTDDPAGLRAILAGALGIRGVVRKQRDLYLAGQTRIHFDEVEGLGRFIELEVVLQDGQGADMGVGIARQLMVALQIEPADLVKGAYADLLGI